MNEDQIQKIINDSYNDKNEDSLMAMLHDFYNRKMLSQIILVWTYGILFTALAIYCGIKYFDTDSTRTQIMLATIFTCCFICIAMLKTFAWQTIHRNSLKREIKRLEIRIAQLTQTMEKD